MNRISLPIHEILVQDRQRLDLGDITELAQSLARYGLIQPVVVNQDKRLIAGGRRLTAAKQLGWTRIDVVFRETLTSDELHELELEENVRRKEMSWQEKALNIAKIYELKCQRSALEGQKWGMKETGEMLGIGKTHVHYCIEIARKLQSELIIPDEKARRYWQCDSMADAWRLRLRDEEDLLAAELAKESMVKAQAVKPILPPENLNKDMSIQGLDDLISDMTEANPSADVSPLEQMRERIVYLRRKPYIQLSYEEAKELYLSNTLNNPDEFDAYYKEKVEWFRQVGQRVPLTSRLHHVNCIEFMSSSEWSETFDHIITDPPYGIDMDMLNQGNDGHAFKDIDTVLEEHKVPENENLFTQFFPAAYNCLKQNGYLVLWCDIMQWQRLYDLAIKAGFKVQRWPITWVKTHRCMNQCANVNFTKSTEIAMVCRKGTVGLSQVAGECHIIAPHDDLKERLGHPFVKPFAVWEYIIDHVSFSGQTILDPFAGRGSCPISVIRKGRHFYACESNEQHFNALIENIKQEYLSKNPNFTFF